jgi:hypothetical protein
MKYFATAVIISTIAVVVAASEANAVCYRKKPNHQCIDSALYSGWDSTCTSPCAVAVIKGKRITLIRRNHRWQQE